MDKKYLKLRDILKIFDGLSDICVWEDSGMEEDDPAFEGTAMNCPFWLSEQYLYNGLDDDYCALSVRLVEKDRPKSVLVVSVTEDGEKAIEW